MNIRLISVNLADIPRAQILIERAGALEHLRHVFHIADIPIANRRVEVSGTLEHGAHTVDVRQVGLPGVGREPQVGGAGKTALHTAPHLVAPLLHAADGGAGGGVAANGKLREIANDGDRVGAGVGVGVVGVADVAAGDAVVSPIHGVIVGMPAPLALLVGMIRVCPATTAQVVMNAPATSGQFVARPPSVMTQSVGCGGESHVWQRHRRIGSRQRGTTHSYSIRLFHSSRPAGRRSFRATA